MCQLRIRLEHADFSIPPITYKRTATDGIIAEQPVLVDLPLLNFVAYTQSRLNLFVEEVLMWSLMRRMPDYVSMLRFPSRRGTRGNANDFGRCSASQRRNVRGC